MLQLFASCLGRGGKKVLARGLRFCLPPKEVDTYDVKCSFELLFRDLSRLGPTLTSENQDRLKSQLKNISYSYIYSYDFSKQKRILAKEEWTALNDLRNDDSIIITKPDKGNGVVIVNKLDYLNKMKQLISDETKFKKLTHNPTKSREDSLISYLRKLRRDGIIDEVTLQRIMPSGSTPGRSSMVFPKFINLDALFVQLFRLLTLIITILPLILCVFFNLSPPTSLQSRTLLVLLNGPRCTTITTSLCALLMLVHCSPTFHLKRQYKSV